MKLNIQLFAYTKKEWKDLPSKDTPILAADLNNIENQLQTNTNDINALNTNLNNIENQLETNTNDINALNTYSTSETIIGKWIDGKPIYRQVINTTGDSNQGQTIATISNIDNIVNMFGWVKNGNMHRSCSTAFFGSTAWASQLYRDSQYIIVECGSNFANFKNNATITLICEYTKTTD